MKFVSGVQAQKFENGASCTAFEYETGHSDINIARIEISGRYPITGSAINSAVTEMVYVESGRGAVTVNGVRTALQGGDVVSIERDEQVHWEGILTLIIACTPAWSPEQYKTVEV